ncbi:EF-P beta-lysylation protein EpmB [Alteromonas confluentis]|uniref:L-lysine 2,3-aminomutase n=1 Tax=Alteromonas confluentis TaxID=1656094 RepID=A0A1E7ZEP7_9ALTE|nr:EF-P beta-lysylation protein EpmB [Alteromonas confluentis]OFC71979.1 EF-P beta-lysylation protein EpmB [Alteromonas confluentis]
MAQIIPKNRLSVETNWQKDLAMAFTRPEDLLNYLDLDAEHLGHHGTARRLFPMRVPRHFASLMEKGNWHDPLLRQVMPLTDEFEAAPGYSADPLEEHDTAGKGLLHKYQSRVLLIVRGGCAVNCRYCFRRHFPYAENAVSKREWTEALKYIAADKNINEVIFSGGDPLMAKDDHLSWLANEIARIPHVRRLRIHTRLPVVMPERLDSAFVNWISELPIPVIVVLHANHANEFSLLLIERLNLLRKAGVMLLNQSVLLKGVNDSEDALVDLQEASFQAGVMPYYLFQLDKVLGAAHFEVSDEKAKMLMAGMIKRLPGYLVPKLTREIGGQPGKTPVDLQLHP